MSPRLRQVLELQNGPTIVAGHSYGGQVVTALGTNAPDVVGLVYINAFGLDEGETLNALLAKGPEPRATAHRVMDKQGRRPVTHQAEYDNFQRKCSSPT
jgi:pimeloyl-ACP methyl ester carboxylesterase